MFNCNWGFMSGFGHGFGMGGFGWLFKILILAILVYFALKLIQKLTTPDGSRDRQDSLEMLKRRYATGDLSTEEYQKMRDILKG